MTDAEGNAIEDLGKLNFAAPLVGQFDLLIEAIERLVGTLTGVTLPAVVERVGGFAQGSGAGSNTNTGAMGMSHGTGGRYVDFGAGTPALLHGKERVMTEAEGRSEVASMAVVEKRLQSIEALLKDQPRAFGIAMSDTMNLAN